MGEGNNPHRSKVTEGENSWNGPQAADRARQANDEVDHFAFRDFWGWSDHEQLGRLLEYVTRANLQTIEWVARQAWAYIELPSRFMCCLTPQDVIAEHGRFANELVQDYQALTSDLVDLFTGPLLDQHRP